MLNDMSFASKYYNIGIDSLGQHNITEAAGYLKKSVEIDGRNTNAINLLGLCYYHLGSMEKAWHLWHKSLEIVNIDNQAQSYLAYMNTSFFMCMIRAYNNCIDLIDKGRWLKAIFQLRRLAKKYPSIVIFNNLMGLCWYKLGISTFAINCYKKVMLIDIGNEEARKYIINAVYRDKE